MGQKSPHPGDSELVELADLLSRAERTKDVAALRRLIADDYVGIAAGGEVLDKATALARFSDPALEFDRHEPSDLEVRRMDRIGLILGKVDLRRRFAGELFAGQFRFLDVCVKRSGRWELVASQLTELPVRPAGGGSRAESPAMKTTE